MGLVRKWHVLKIVVAPARRLRASVREGVWWPVTLRLREMSHPGPRRRQYPRNQVGEILPRHLVGGRRRQAARLRPRQRLRPVSIPVRVSTGLPATPTLPSVALTGQCSPGGVTPAEPATWCHTVVLALVNVRR